MNKPTKKEMLLAIFYFTILVLIILGGGYIDQQFLEAGIIH